MSTGSNNGGDEFKKNEILSNTSFFSELSRKYIKSFLNVDTTPEGEAIYSKNDLQIEHNISVSILFTGLIFGEYILSINEETAANLMGKTIKDADASKIADIRDEISETFSELLNQIVGESIVNLSSSYQKLTITVPKINFGMSRYPRVKSGRQNLNSSYGNIGCYLYIDHMKLDIASSYKKALESFMQANYDLKAVLKKLEEQQMMLVQSERLAALGTMAGGVAHEINTPLAVIQLRTDQLLGGLSEEGDIDRTFFNKSLIGIDSTVKKISKIVSGLLKFSRDGSKDPPSPHQVSTIIDDSIILCREKYRSYGVEIRLSFCEDNVVNCRAGELSQVFINLLNNSFYALQSLDEKWIDIKCVKENERIKVYFTDSGHGLPETVYTKMMQPFFTTKPIGQGTGLGLSISKGIIESLNGNLSYNSQCKNTQFVIDLPAAKSDSVNAKIA